MYYTCLGDDCSTTGFTAHPPTFSRDFIGYLCPECTEMILRPESTGIFCVRCKHVLILESESHAHRAPATTPQDHLVYADACPICEPGMQSLEVRTTLLVNQLPSEADSDQSASNMSSTEK